MAENKNIQNQAHEVEVTLRLKVPYEFEGSKEILLDEAFADVVREYNCEVISSSEYRHYFPNQPTEVPPQRIVIELEDGKKLVAFQNTDPNYRREIFLGLEDRDEVWFQDLAIVRQDYGQGDNFSTVWKKGKYEVCVYADKDKEDYTHIFHIDEYVAPAEDEPAAEPVALEDVVDIEKQTKHNNSVMQGVIDFVTEGECPHGGDTSNDCADCAYSGDYHFVDGECVRRDE